MAREEPTSRTRPRIPSSIRRRHSPHHHPSNSPSRRTSPVATPWKSRPTPRPIEVFHKSYSEPLIFPVIGDGDVGCRSFGSDEGGWFCRVHTLDDLVLCDDDSSEIVAPRPLSPQIDTVVQGYKKDTRVLITVTVEGSPGPIKTLVKLGASVDDTIKLVVQKYGEEGRTPRLDKNAASSFDLHVSYFSLQCLDRAYAIGDVGTRSFYLRKISKKSQDANGLEVVTSDTDRSCVSKQSSPHMVTFPSFFARKLRKFVRRVQRLFILLGCLHSR